MVSLGRRIAAESLGTGFLVMAVIGSGIAAQRLSPDEAGLQLLVNALITGAALVALILALQPVSAAFNPVVTLIERAFGAITTAQAAALIAAQIVGGFIGAVLANLMFDRAAVSVSTHARTGSGFWLAEVVATVGLLLIVFGAVRSGPPTGSPLPWADTSPPPTGSPVRPALPTRQSQLPGCFLTASPESPRPRCPCLCSCS